jgi:hypothetical protein
MPFPVTLEVLKRGQERFNIYCTPCHSRVGNGLGEIVERGYKPAANFHDQVRLSQPISHYFYVMTHGYGAMPDYSAQLTPVDRWAVAAYIRALQLSQAATSRMCRPAFQCAEPEGDCGGEGHARVCQPWALPATAFRLIRRSEAGNTGAGSGQSGGPGDQDSQQANRPPSGRGKDRTEWLTRHTPRRFPPNWARRPLWTAGRRARWSSGWSSR